MQPEIAIKQYTEKSPLIYIVPKQHKIPAKANTAIIFAGTKYFIRYTHIHLKIINKTIATMK